MRQLKNTFILFLVFQHVGHAQSDSLKKQPLAKCYAGTMSFGVYGFTHYNLDRGELQLLNSGNQLLKKDITPYTYDSNNGEFSGFCINSGLSLIFYNKKKQAYNKGQEFHFGISYQSNEKLQYNYVLNERTPFDTLRSNTSPHVYYIDTVKTTW